MRVMIKKLILVSLIVFPVRLYAFDMSLGVQSSIGFTPSPLMAAGSIGIFSDIGFIRALALSINVDAALYNGKIETQLETLAKGRLALNYGRLSLAFGGTFGLTYHTIDLTTQLGYELDMSLGFLSLALRNSYQIANFKESHLTHRPLSLAVGYGIRFG